MISPLLCFPAAILTSSIRVSILISIDENHRRIDTARDSIQIEELEKRNSDETNPRNGGSSETGRFNFISERKARILLTGSARYLAMHRVQGIHVCRGAEVRYIYGGGPALVKMLSGGSAMASQEIFDSDAR